MYDEPSAGRLPLHTADSLIAQEDHFSFPPKISPRSVIMRRYDEQDSGPVGSLSAGKSELHGKNWQQKVNLTNIGRKLGTGLGSGFNPGKENQGGGCSTPSEKLLRLYTWDQDLVQDNQQQLEHEN